MPEEVRSGGGLNLNRSELFTTLCKLLGIRSKVTHPYAPQGNTVESWHRCVGTSEVYSKILLQKKNAHDTAEFHEIQSTKLTILHRDDKIGTLTKCKLSTM